MKDMSRQLLMVLMVLLGGLAIAPLRIAIAQVPDQGTFPNSTSGDLADPSLPNPVREAVIQAAAVQSGLQPEQLALTQAKSKVWSDGCLGLAPPEQMCAAVLVRGWEVTVTHQRQEWVYRTSATGEKIVLDPAGSHLSRLIVPPAEQIPSNQLPPKVDRSVVFREIKSGGIAGITEEIRLYKDGRLMKQPPLRVPKPNQGQVIRTIPKAEVKAFRKLLESHHFGQFDGLRYPASKSATDYFTFTLGNWQTTVQYADGELPSDLEQIAKAWRLLVAPR
jgi:hypothetical protein